MLFATRTYTAPRGQSLSIIQKERSPSYSQYIGTMIPIACTKITETRRIVLIRRKTSLPRLIPSHLQAMYQRYVPLGKGARRRPLQTTSPPPTSRPPKSLISESHNTPSANTIAPSYRPVLLDERSSICRYHPPILLRPASSSSHRHYPPKRMSYTILRLTLNQQKKSSVLIILMTINSIYQQSKHWLSSSPPLPTELFTFPLRGAS